MKDFEFTRRQFMTKAAITGAVAGVSTLSGCGGDMFGAGKREQRPNFVYIMTDDQPADGIGFMGRYPFLKTPNMDRLAAEGLWCKNAFVVTSLCSPSRAAFLTGCYAHRNSVEVNELNDPGRDAPFMPALLQECGYETAFIGKWHMKKGAMPRGGFDYWLSFDGQGEYIDPEINENGTAIKETGYITDILTDYAQRWLNKDRSKPFCLFLWHKAAHGPFIPAPRHKELYKDAVIPEPVSFADDYEGKPKWQRRGIMYGIHRVPWIESEGKPVPPTVPLKKWQADNPDYLDYFRTYSAVDESVGRIYNTLENMGCIDDTMLIYGSDNGFMLGEHQTPIDKRAMWEESIKIPFLIRYPKLVKPGTVINEMILNIDLAPTFLEFAGCPKPDNMQGSSFASILRGRNSNWRKSFMYEYFQEQYAPGIVTMVGVRTERYKYIEYPNQAGDINELYDLKKDPYEMQNLINDSAYAAKLKELETELKRLKKETGYDKV